jgi:heptosyltransferase-3
MKQVLVVVTRRIGDVLLATPLMRSLKRAWPAARIDALVFRGTESVLAGNVDLNSVVTVAERPGFAEHARLHAALARRYDLAVSLLTGDRPTLYAWTAGRRRAGLQMSDPGSRWKQRLLDLWVPFDDLDTHVVRMNLALASALGTAPLPEVVVSWAERDAQRVEALGLRQGAEPYAVMHPSARFNYKMWHVDGWAGLGRRLRERGLNVYVSGSNDAHEAAYAAAITERVGQGARNLAGELSLGALGCLLSGAAVYAGPDTVVTHMAAALGVPTVALFGPSNPVRWGPWPKGHAAALNPWRRVGTQRRGNVTLLQGTTTCVPCLLEGCGRNIASYSDCLQQLPLGTVVDEVEARLASGAPP